MRSPGLRLFVFLVLLLGNGAYIAWRVVQRPVFQAAPYVAFDGDERAVIVRCAPPDPLLERATTQPLFVSIGGSSWDVKPEQGQWRAVVASHVSETFHLDGLPRGATVTCTYVEEPRRAGDETHSYTFSFRTPPESGPVRFALLGDSGKSRNGTPWREPGRQAEVAAQILAERPDFVLHAGDVVYPDGSWDEYPEGFFGPFAKLLQAGVPIYAAVGNHDLHLPDVGAPFRAAFGYPPPSSGVPLHRSFDWGDLHVAIWDSCTNEPETAAGAAELAWLDQDLAKTGKKWKVVLAHYPAFQVGQKVQHAGVISPILVRNHVAACLAGHYHVYERCDAGDGVLYLTSGGGGKSLDEAGDSPHAVKHVAAYHHVLATLENDKLTLDAIGLDGKSFDHIVLSPPK